MPVTFSFRAHEPTFFENLQNFAKAFISLRDGVNPNTLKPVDTFRDKYDKVHDVYFDFKLNVPQRAADPTTISRFSNIKAADVRLPPDFSAGKNMWILKPSCMSRGRGLELFTDLNQLAEFIRMYLSGYDAKDYSQMKYSHKLDRSPSMKPDKSPKKKKHNDSDDFAYEEPSPSKGRNGVSFLSNNTFQVFVIQKYMEKPFLYKGYKFDIRVYDRLTHTMQLRLFCESYVRLSSYPYTLDKMNYYIHLTNNAVQSTCAGYGALLQGNIFPISELERYANELGKTADPFMTQIKNTIKKVFDATFDILNPKGRKHNFELFGFDFMIDEHHKVWLLECNSGPSMSESNTFLSGLLHRMLGKVSSIRRPFPDDCGHSLPSS